MRREKKSFCRSARPGLRFRDSFLLVPKKQPSNSPPPKLAFRLARLASFMRRTGRAHGFWAAASLFRRNRLVRQRGKNVARERSHCRFEGKTGRITCVSGSIEQLTGARSMRMEIVAAKRGGSRPCKRKPILVKPPPWTQGQGTPAIPPFQVATKSRNPTRVGRLLTISSSHLSGDPGAKPPRRPPAAWEDTCSMSVSELVWNCPCSTGGRG